MPKHLFRHDYTKRVATPRFENRTQLFQAEATQINV